MYLPTGLSTLEDFGRSVNPISTKGDRLCPPNNTGTPGFSDLPTALLYTNMCVLILNFLLVLFFICTSIVF